MDNNLWTALQTNWISLVVSIGVIAILYVLAKKRVGFGTRVLLALGIGLVAGIFFNSYKLDYKSVSTIGTIYVNLIKMLVIPLVFVLVINSIAQLSNLGQLRKIGVKTISWFLLTTGIAAIIGLIVALIVDPGAGIEAAVPKDYKPRDIPTFSQVI
ncbi:MAG: amino acid:proton symporter, partial [Paenibacillus sp.]|nr:amino acid:proton symporter [Paenibacillus sp.]